MLAVMCLFSAADVSDTYYDTLLVYLGQNVHIHLSQDAIILGAISCSWQTFLYYTVFNTVFYTDSGLHHRVGTSLCKSA